MEALRDIAAMEPEAALAKLNSAPTGLTEAEAGERLRTIGPNAIHTHHFTIFGLLLRQLKNPILILLAVAAAIAGSLGDAGNASVIAVILTLSVGLGLSTEYRAERASADLQTRNTHRATVVRAGSARMIDVTQLVPGDLVQLSLGAVIPADLRLTSVADLECDESILTGESLPVAKAAGVLPASADELSNCALMGTVVRSGSGIGVVVRTGGATEFGQIAQSLSTNVPETDFQRGLRRFSLFLLWVAVGQAVLIVGVNWALGKNLIENVLFALAIAVGMTPQLLPAVVSTALALGSRQLAKNGVLVKRLVSIEDLGDLDVLLTDKTGTLTAGAVAFESAVDFGAGGTQANTTEQASATQYGINNTLRLGLLATDADYAVAAGNTAGLNPLDAALWSTEVATSAAKQGFPKRLDAIAFDHERRIASALIVAADGPLLVSKGSPEDIMSRCQNVSEAQQNALTELYNQGKRVVAVASKSMPASSATITPADENGLTLTGLLSFADPAKPDVQDSLTQLAELGIDVKIATGDSAEVAVTVCKQVGIEVAGVLTGRQLDDLSDAELAGQVGDTTIFARVSPEQKARILRALRASGKAVGFLGDGVNDAIALHDADVGISVDSATDVAKDAADVVLLEKDLGVLATGVRQGRRVFSNTMKYVLMGTSSDFGNNISAAIGSMILPFLPMAPSQLLLQALLYDSSQLAIPTDRVDAEQTARPSHWRIAFIGRFMIVFGLASSIFDFATFGLMAFGFHAKVNEFQTGWFVESLATATLIVFAIRTRRVPFLRSRPSLQLIASVLSVVAIGVIITYLPLGGVIGFTALPAPFFLALVAMIVIYLVIVEVAKKVMFGWGTSRSKRLAKVAGGQLMGGATSGLVPSSNPRSHGHRVHRRAAKFVAAGKPKR